MKSQPNSHKHSQVAQTQHHNGQTNHDRQGTPAYNSTYPKSWISCSKDSFIVNQTLVFQMNYCGKKPALWVVAKRYRLFYDDTANIELTTQNIQYK
jgi:hypothetical protein